MARHYFAAPDGYDEPTLWEHDSDRPDYPQPILSRHDITPEFRDRVWPLIVAAVTKPCSCPTDSEIDAAIEAATANLHREPTT